MTEDLPYTAVAASSNSILLPKSDPFGEISKDDLFPLFWVVIPENGKNNVAICFDLNNNNDEVT